MSSAAPSELNAAAVISLIASGAYPHEVVLTIARGFLPLPQEELLAVMAFLAISDDEEIARLAGESLAEMPPQVVMAFARNEAVAPRELINLARGTRDDAVLESLIRNRGFPDQAIIELARQGAANVQEVIVINQARIIRTPAILDALLENPRLTADVRRRALETREEFFDKKARAQQVADEAAEEEELANISLEAIADLLEKAALEPDAPTVLELSEADRSDPKKLSLLTRILAMNVSEKVQLAFKGDKSVRMILVRERNRLVSSSTMRNPRMTENEVEMIAGMRNVEEEVLRLIGMKREWVSKYPIAIALVRNPKAPVGVVLPLINRLTLRDLKGLKDDKGVSEAVRTAAKRLFLARSQKS
ncbi:MAG: hypothetical protein JWN02_2174 [Acidobacteria bacterium]|nr:hypothetical protein [Acidobacteriota bacterium]